LISRSYIIAVILFKVESAVCDAAPNTDALIAGRIICGLGGMGIYIGALNIISMIIKDVERPFYLSFSG